MPDMLRLQLSVYVRSVVSPWVVEEAFGLGPFTVCPATVTHPCDWLDLF